jgi:chromatin structure-remodeling complex subunit RSC1/2
VPGRCELILYSGHDPSKVFHKRVNKRNVPTYYEVIKEPMAFSNLKFSSVNREYKKMKDFVRDCALIWHNAHTYNRPDAGAYQDANTIKRLMEEQLQKLVDRDLLDPKDAAWPDLGEIPPVEDLPPDEEGDEDGEEDAEGEEDDDEDGEDSDEDGPRKRRSRGGRPSTSRRDTKDDGEPETKKRRGRPPKVDTPMEARIKNVLKGIRKPKNEEGNIMIHAFEKLPDKTTMPEYYAEIKHAIAIEQIKVSSRELSVWCNLWADVLFRKTKSASVTTL